LKTDDKTQGYSLLGQFENTRHFLKWAKVNYRSFKEMQEKNQKYQLKEEVWERISGAIIFSIMGLEAFLNEMACLAFKGDPKLTDFEKDYLQRQIESGHSGYLPILKRICVFTQIVVRLKFPTGKVPSWVKLKRLVKYRNILVHSAQEVDSPDLILSAVKMKNRLASEADISIPTAPLSFSQIIDDCDFDPCEVVKDIITAIEGVGYRLPDSFKDALAGM
jgi:hypothetical protein